MKEFMKWVCATVVAVVVGLVMVFAFPVLHHGRSLRDGSAAKPPENTGFYIGDKDDIEWTVLDFRIMIRECEVMGAEERELLSEVILIRASVVDTGNLPDDVREFLIRLKERRAAEAGVTSEVKGAE